MTFFAVSPGRRKIGETKVPTSGITLSGTYFLCPKLSPFGSCQTFRLSCLSIPVRYEGGTEIREDLGAGLRRMQRAGIPKRVEKH